MTGSNAVPQSWLQFMAKPDEEKSGIGARSRFIGARSRFIGVNPGVPKKSKPAKRQPEGVTRDTRHGTGDTNSKTPLSACGAGIVFNW